MTMRRCWGGSGFGDVVAIAIKASRAAPIRGILQRPPLVERVVGSWIARSLGSCRPGLAQSAGGDCPDQCAASTGVD